MASVKHSDRKHALLSASGASRWLNCPPSARLEEGYPDSTSEFAEEGTLAHEFGDAALQLANGTMTSKQYSDLTKKLRKHKLYSAEMPGEVEKYTDYVLEQFSAAKKNTPGAVLLVEEKVDFSEYVENGFGTNDASIIADDTLEIVDLKYGKGVPVYAKENPQGMLYAIGALHKYDLSYDIKNVKITIHQPRLNHVDSWTITADALHKWAEVKVKPAAELAYAGKGVQKAGAHCKWCKVKAECATLASYNLRIAKREFKNEDDTFKDPHLLTDAQLIDVYGKLDLLTEWAAAIKTHMLKTALDGKQWPGYKVVEGRSNHHWLNEDKVIERLKDEAFSDAQIFNKKLKGITDIEKTLGKATFEEIMAGLVGKPPGKPTFVKESDKRPAIGSTAEAIKDFS